jgi:hypothetical protein
MFGHSVSWFYSKVCFVQYIYFIVYLHCNKGFSNCFISWFYFQRMQPTSPQNNQSAGWELTRDEEAAQLCVPAHERNKTKCTSKAADGNVSPAPREKPLSRDHQVLLDLVPVHKKKWKANEHRDIYFFWTPKVMSEICNIRCLMTTESCYYSIILRESTFYSKVTQDYILVFRSKNSKASVALASVTLNRTFSELW